MVDLDPTTPQLKVVKQWDHACTSLNIKNIEPILSKDFRFMAFPKIAEHPDLTKEEFIQTYGKMFDSLVKMESVYHEVIDAPGKVVLHHTGFFTTASGTTLDCDSVFIVSFVEENGALKVLEIKAFSSYEKRMAFHNEIPKTANPVA